MTAALPWIRPCHSAREAWRRLYAGPFRYLALRMAGTARLEVHPDGATPHSRWQLTGFPCAEIGLSHDAEMAPETGFRMIVNGYSQSVEVARSAIAWQMLEMDSAEAFEFPLSESEALEVAGRMVTRLRLGRVLPSPRGREFHLSFLGVHWHPYWVHYFKVRHGRVDFGMVDAVTGRKTGSGGRHALMAALAFRNRQQNT